MTSPAPLPPYSQQLYFHLLNVRQPRELGRKSLRTWRRLPTYPSSPSPGLPRGQYRTVALLALWMASPDIQKLRLTSLSCSLEMRLQPLILPALGSPGPALGPDSDNNSLHHLSEKKPSLSCGHTADLGMRGLALDPRLGEPRVSQHTKKFNLLKKKHMVLLWLRSQHTVQTQGDALP